MMDSASTVGHRCGSDAASGVRQNAPSGKGASLFQSRSTRRSVKRAVRSSLPVMLGLAFSNVCFNVAFNESTAHFEDALRGNAPVFVALALMGLFMLVLFRRAEPLRPETAAAGAVACIAAQILSAAMLGLLDPVYVDTDAARILATSVMDVGALGALGYWLRCASGASATVAAIVVSSSARRSSARRRSCPMGRCTSCWVCWASRRLRCCSGRSAVRFQPMWPKGGAGRRLRQSGTSVWRACLPTISGCLWSRR